MATETELSRSTQLLRNLVSLSTGQLATRLIGFAAFAVLARRLEPGAYGSVELAVALALFFAMLADFGLGTIGARTIARDRQQVACLAAQIPAARLLMTVVAIPAMGGVAMAAGLPQSTIDLVWLFSVGLLAVPWFQRWLFLGLEMMKLVSIGQVVRASVFCLGVVIFVQEPGDLMVVGQAEIAAAALATIYYLAAQTLWHSSSSCWGWWCSTSPEPGCACTASTKVPERSRGRRSPARCWKLAHAHGSAPRPR